MRSGILGDGPHPAVVVYDAIPGGIGLSERLYELQTELLIAGAGVGQGLPVQDGCPSCVGPGGEFGSGGKNETTRHSGSHPACRERRRNEPALGPLEIAGRRLGADGIKPPAPSKRTPIEKVLDGSFVKTIYGECFKVEQFFPAEYSHGNVASACHPARPAAGGVGAPGGCARPRSG